MSRFPCANSSATFLINSKRRGSVLIHVLVTGVIVAFIAAGLLQMTLTNYQAVDRVQKNEINRKEADGMLNRAITYWNANEVCSNQVAFPCAGVPGTCNCKCPNAVDFPRIEVTGGGPPPCSAVGAVKVISKDAQ